MQKIFDIYDPVARVYTSVDFYSLPRLDMDADQFLESARRFQMFMLVLEDAGNSVDLDPGGLYFQDDGDLTVDWNELCPDEGVHYCCYKFTRDNLSDVRCGPGGTFYTQDAEGEVVGWRLFHVKSVTLEEFKHHG